jgi:uncharacterized protein
MLSVAVVVAVLTLRNIAGDTLVPPAWYVPTNLAVGALLLAIAVASGVSVDELGLAGSDVARGLWIGAAVVVAAVSVVAVGAALPITRGLFEDQRVADVTNGGQLAYQALVRIPLGTALFEEVAFRGVLLALVARHWSLGVAVAASSALFGLWHIRPTMAALAANDLAVSGVAQTSAVVGAVVVTAVAGVLFCVLRLWSGSLVAPVLVHAAINSSSIVAAYLVLRST